jgi:hypothetical protein
MQRHPDTPNGVMLDDRENEVTDLFLQIVLEEHLDIPTAARYALSALPDPDPAFVSWLSHGTLTA